MRWDLWRMTPKLKTIRRRPLWPKFARWYCRQNPSIGKYPLGRLSERKPGPHPGCLLYSYPHWQFGSGKWLMVRVPRLGKEWRKSLRRIVP